jgi:hypothetical protein
MSTSFSVESFADAHRLLPIGGERTAEIAVLDRALVVLAGKAVAVDRAGPEGMWRTWKLEALVDAENGARVAASLAMASIPADRAELRELVERRCAGIDAFLARYPNRRS